MISRVEAWFLHAVTLLVGGTGIVYAILRYLVPPADEFSVVGHPWQPHTQHLHVLAAPLLVFGAGLIWKRHVADRWQNLKLARRVTGIAIALVLPIMILSGYFVQTSVAPALHKFWVVTHVVSSCVWLAGYAAHQLRPKTK